MEEGGGGGGNAGWRGVGEAYPKSSLDFFLSFFVVENLGSFPSLG